MRIQGARAGVAAEIIRRGTARDISLAGLKWFEANGLIDPRTDDPETLLYWEAIRNGILRVTYTIKVQAGAPALIIDTAAVRGIQVPFGDPTKMLSHAMALGLCSDGPLKLSESHGEYLVAHR